MVGADSPDIGGMERAMRHPALFVLLCAALACNDGFVLQPGATETPTPAFVSSGADHGPVIARATGSGHYRAGADNLLRTFSFNALRYSDGSVAGHFQLDNRARDVRAHGTVTCLSIDGNRAWVGAVVDWVSAGGSTSIEVGQSRGWLAIDNGEGMMSVPDEMSALPAIANCEDRPPIATRFLEAGNIQVMQK